MEWSLWSLIFGGRESHSPLQAAMGRCGRGFSLDQSLEREVLFHLWFGFKALERKVKTFHLT